MVDRDPSKRVPATFKEFSYFILAVIILLGFFVGALLILLGKVPVNDPLVGVLVGATSAGMLSLAKDCTSYFFGGNKAISENIANTADALSKLPTAAQTSTVTTKTETTSPADRRTVPPPAPVNVEPPVQ